jgi:hypothetical protein
VVVSNDSRWCGAVASARLELLDPGWIGWVGRIGWIG